uniref:ATP synthase complex subunit 8 n=1 Tax=Andrias japonicus TaxID=166789 RepID=Q3LGC8_ANDJA|nr:ATP synthase F0 subunit 8 [Andrias japonicus]BAE45323.1 ATP synthase F0 subunit 8 [Andrias japonicus]
MPQLSPGPWFAIFMISWMILLLILMPKINNLKNMNEPTSTGLFLNKPQSWNWPWI